MSSGGQRRLIRLRMLMRAFAGHPGNFVGNAVPRLIYHSYSYGSGLEAYAIQSFHFKDNTANNMQSESSGVLVLSKGHWIHLVDFSPPFITKTYLYI